MAKYPVPRVGQRATSALLLSLMPDTIYKTADEDRNSTTTLTDDDELTTTLQANSVYLVEFELHYATLNVAGFKTDWTTPAGSSGLKSVLGPGSTQTEGTANNISGRFGVHGYATVVTYGNRDSSTNQLVARETSLITTTSSGTVAIRWAQNASNAGATRVAAGSFMRVRKLA